MTLFSKVFTTRTLVQIAFVLFAIIVMKGLSAHFDFSWWRRDKRKPADPSRGYRFMAGDQRFDFFAFTFTAVFVADFFPATLLPPAASSSFRRVTILEV
jgi:hypothetical protein